MSERQKPANFRNLLNHVSVANAKRVAASAEELAQRVLATVGARQPESRISADSQTYWRRPSGDRWQANAHWRDASVFQGSDLWSRLGREHLDLFDAGARMASFTGPWHRVLEWGCGGGANAIHFAPRAEEFIGIDIAAETLHECERQVKAACDTPFLPVAIDVAKPEEALDAVGGLVDVFFSCYVFELIPTPEYGERLLRIARQLLTPDGLAMIQIKYDPGSWRTGPRRRAYRNGLAGMTTYGIDAFWQTATRCGLQPLAVHLVPKNDLDERYAYFFLRNGSPS
ncbi:bifunctional 2-polyprenyl-6-hydroxyphenol methylase/3-demethylubiquinol 3-O-methyltransferase UbiG [Amycolatopsis sp. DSM 110486]|uniref:class I SAM-dependent methyltransferase n=1 Tax=Amycolatopsis sp. DSM 110486 TaxID=2865832 RepID=UPI001C69DF18|nr:class I SAM-dependent methyltransferase [Amycolatopsis sp. DSM 110486]QYN22958.1 class I SAM-dependent methyltransferase [Amycolatopsis sp. DSM 110486]